MNRQIYPRTDPERGFLLDSFDPGAPIDPETGKPMRYQSAVNPLKHGKIWRLTDLPRVSVMPSGDQPKRIAPIATKPAGKLNQDQRAFG